MGEVGNLAGASDYRQQMQALGGEPMPKMSPREFDAFLKKEIERNIGIVKAAGIKPQ